MRGAQVNEVMFRVESLRGRAAAAEPAARFWIGAASGGCGLVRKTACVLGLPV